MKTTILALLAAVLALPLAAQETVIFSEASFPSADSAATPLGRIALPSDVANVAAFLASSDSDFLTGLAITVAGGAVMS